MNELSKADTLKILKKIKREFESECKLVYDRSSLFPSNEGEELYWVILSTYVSAMETAIRCVEKGEEGEEGLKPCPFCGKKVELMKEPLWQEYKNTTHGYYGSYEYVVKCRNPECQCQIYLGKNDTIYRDDETAQRNAIEAWNRRA